ncbi:MAG TPA: sulfotransferase [Paraburkholderia sp.]
MPSRPRASDDPHEVILRQARQILADAPEDAGTWHRLGWAHELRGELEEAVSSYRRALQYEPRADGSYNNLAVCLNALGQFEKARVAWRAAIRLTPGCAAYYRNLVQSWPLPGDDACFASLEQQIGHPDTHTRPAAEQADLLFAYGQSLTAQGEAARGFEQIAQANALYRTCVFYNEEAALGVCAERAKRFTPALLRDKGGAGDPSTLPVMVLGMPRSGSTLVEQILASHPQVAGVGEPQHFEQALGQAVRGVDALRLNQLDEVTSAQLRALGQDYLQRLRHTANDDACTRIVDKYPYNFVHLGFIHLALPNARIIHVHRAPLDTCLSIYTRWFRDVPFGYDLGELGRYYRAYDALMAHWRDALPPGVLLDVAYEDLVDDLEGVAKRMIAHCGLEWDARCLAFHETGRAVATASARQVRQPLYRTSLRRWRPPAQTLQPLIDGLGPRLAATSR